MQKLYLSDEVKGKGYGKLLAAAAEKEAVRLGYRKLYIETHCREDVYIPRLRENRKAIICAA